MFPGICGFVSNYIKQKIKRVPLVKNIRESGEIDLNRKSKIKSK